MLERHTSSLIHSAGMLCVFTVVPNAFMGFEYTEHTCFDMIILQKTTQSTQDIGSDQFVQLLRGIGAMTPVVLLHDRGESPEEVPMSLYSNLLANPFSSRDLCALVEQTLNPNISRPTSLCHECWLAEANSGAPKNRHLIDSGEGYAASPCSNCAPNPGES